MGGTKASKRPTHLDRLKIEDLVDLRTLQQLQNWFAEMTGISAAIRGPEGGLVTKSSHVSRICEYIHENEKGCEACRLSNQAAYAKAAAAVEKGKAGSPVKYVCHAGLTQFAAPITVGGRTIATLVVGDRPARHIGRKRLDRLARDLSLDPARLREYAARLKPWSEGEMRRSIEMLHTVAGTIAEIGYQGYQLRQQLRALGSLYETSKLLTSTLDLQEVLDIISRHVTRSLGMHACSLRLLVRSGRELEISSYYNLSRRYMDKGPVIVARSPIDQKALSGKMVVIKDVMHDSRVLYPADALREGIRSGIAVPLIAKDTAIGALHLYSSDLHTFTPEEKHTIRAMANHAATAIENARLYRASRKMEELDREMASAREIQERLLPDANPDVPGYDIAAVSHPARHVGGDFYDFIDMSDGRLGVVIGDVAGKGMPAAILMAGTRAALRANAETPAGRQPAVIVDRVNKALCRDTSSSQFVSVFYGVLKLKSGYFAYTNAGHNRPLLVSKGARWLRSGGMVVGAVPDVGYEEGRVFLKSGDVLALYTDGVTEGMNRDNAPFGADRLMDVVRRNRRHKSATILQAVRDAVREFRGGLPAQDDLTLVVIKMR